MGLQLPPWARKVFLITTGDGWPEADEDQLWRLAREWTGIAVSVSELAERIVEPARLVRRTDWDGPAAAAFAASSDAFTGADGQALRGVADGSQELADFIYDSAVNVQYMKIIVLEELVVLFLQISYLIATSVSTLGASLSAVPALEALGRLIARSAVLRLAMWIAASELSQIGLDAIDQLAQMAVHTRKRWDTHLTTSAAITGAVALPMGKLGDGLRHLLRGVARPTLGTRAATSLGHAMGGAVEEYLTSAGTGVVTGQGWIGTPWDVTAGAIQGAATGFRRGGETGMHEPVLPLTARQGLVDGPEAGARHAVVTEPGQNSITAAELTQGERAWVDELRRMNLEMRAADGSPEQRLPPRAQVRADDDASAPARGPRPEHTVVVEPGQNPTAPERVQPERVQPERRWVDQLHRVAQEVPAEATGLFGKQWLLDRAQVHAGVAVPASHVAVPASHPEVPASHPEVPAPTGAASWTVLRESLRITDDEARRVVRWLGVGWRPDNLDRAAEVLGVYGDLYGGDAAAPRRAGWISVGGMPVDPRRLADLHRVLELARPGLPRQDTGQGPMTRGHLLPLVRHMLDRRATAVTTDHVDQLVRGLRATRSGVRGLLRARTGFSRSDGPGTARRLDRYLRRTAQAPGGVDGRVNRGAELTALQAALAQDRPSGAQPHRFTAGDLATLVDGRRSYYPDPRQRGFSDIGDYSPMARDLLGTNRVDPVTLASLADLARTVRIGDRVAVVGDRPVTRSGLVRAAIDRDWSSVVRPQAPEASAPGTDAEVSALVPGLLRMGEIPFGVELTAWLNGIVPGTHRPIPLADVEQALAWSFGSAMDEGVRFTVPLTAEADAGTGTSGAQRPGFVVTLHARAVGDPQVTTLDHLPPGSSLTLEQRATGLESSLTHERREETGAHVDVGLVHRMSSVVQYGLLGSGGVGRATGPAFVAGSSTERKVMFKPRGAAIRLHTPITWSARVQDVTTGRWRDFVWAPDGAAWRDAVPLYVQVPVPDPSQRGLRALSGSGEFPLWEMPHAVERIVAADGLRARLRELIGEREYSFWERPVEDFLSNNQLGQFLADAHRATPEFQDVPRIMLRRAGRFLTMALTAQPVSVENAGPAESNFAYVQESRAINQSALHQEKQTAWRGRGYGGVGALSLGLIGGQGRARWSTTRIWTREQRSMGDRALYVHDTNRVVLLRSRFVLDVHWGDDAHRPHEGSTVPVDGLAFVRARESDLSAAAAAGGGWAGGTVPVADVAARRWWTARPGGDQGIGLGVVDSVSRKGIAGVYDRLVPALVRRGYLPADALGLRGQTPWQHLQALPRSGVGLNRPGVSFTNWRSVVDQLSEAQLRRRVDDLMSAEAGQPGIVMTLVDPALPAGAAARRVLMVGLGVSVDGPGTFLRTENLHPANGWFGTQEVRLGRRVGRVREASVSVIATAGERLGHAVPVGEAEITKRSHSARTATRIAAATSMSVISILGDASLFRLPVTLTATIHDGARPTEVRVQTTMRVWQPTAMTDSADAAAPSRSTAPSPSRSTIAPSPVSRSAPLPAGAGAPGPAPRTPSPLAAVAMHAPVEVSGVGTLRAALVRHTGADQRDVWEGLTALAYKANLGAILSSGHPVALGTVRAMLHAEPVGRPTIVRQATAYIAAMRESDTGTALEVGDLAEKGGLLQVTAPVFHDAGVAAARDSGGGHETSTGRTAGTTRVVTTPSTDVYLVRTAVRNTVRLSSGRAVSSDGELVVAVPGSSVRSWDRHAFDDPHQLLGPDAPAAPGPPREPPLSLRDGRLWSGVWLEPLGRNQLHDVVTRDALALGGDDLRVQVVPLLSGVTAWLTELDDGGRTWQVRSGGHVYELTLTARAAGTARHVEDHEGGHLKLRSRYGEHQHGGVTSRRTTAVTAHLGSGLDPTHDGGTHDPSASWAGGDLTESRAVDARHLAGSASTQLVGERPVHITQFTQPVEFSYRLRRAPGRFDSISAVVRGAGSRTGTVVLELPVFVPLSGSTQVAVPEPGHQVSIRSVLPDNAVVLGLHGAAAIAAVAGVKQTGRTGWNSRSPASSGLNPSSLAASLGAMLSEKGAVFTEVGPVGAAVEIPGGVAVRARFGTLRHIYGVGTSEIEDFGFMERTNGRTRGETGRRESSVHSNPRVTLVPHLGLTVGLHLGAGIEQTVTEDATTGRADEYVSGLRHRGSTFHLYLPVIFSVAVGGQAPVEITASAEIVVTRSGALEMGVPAEMLDAVSGVSESLKHKEFALD